ncbi:hypothetical protein FRC12_006969 [Ceratobasidium sp. 428]|nr:hypothetical protein FRC12_006969 [Ceratobasidium sp. 428]
MFSSDLKRAHSTAQAIHAAQPEPKPPLITTQLLREQHWGDAEGETANAPWLPLKGRDSRFPNGESLNDVARRGEQFFDQYLTSIVKEAKGKPIGEVNVVVVSHGIAIAENIGALFRRSVEAEDREFKGSFLGLMNTAWTRVIVGLEDELLPEEDDEHGPSSQVAATSTPDSGAVLNTAVETSVPPALDGSEPSPLLIKAKIVARNQRSHLTALKEEEAKSTVAPTDDAALKMQTVLSGGEVN